MKDADSVDILNDGHTKLAAKLMVEEGLDEEATYYVADQIMPVVIENTENQ
jgi:hypothetical protein